MVEIHYVNHSIIAKMFKEKVKSLLKGKMKKQPTKNRPNPSSNPILNFFTAKNSF
jgi:hypothetical protein